MTISRMLTYEFLFYLNMLSLITWLSSTFKSEMYSNETILNEKDFYIF